MSLELVPVTTWSRRKRHWALPDALHPYRHGGRSGIGLCPQSSGCTDQEATEAEAKEFGWAPGKGAFVVVADLPPCKLCELRRRRLAAVPVAADPAFPGPAAGSSAEPPPTPTG